MGNSIELSGVEETLMIPLWARANSTRQRGLIHDPAAVDLAGRLDYDFKSKLNHARAVAAFMIVRAKRFDEKVRDFIDRHPDGVVVEIGCGLDTRWERCDGYRVDWFDLDLDPVIALRQRYFRDGARRRMIAASLQDTGWHALWGPRTRPFLFVAEGVLLYQRHENDANYSFVVSYVLPLERSSPVAPLFRSGNLRACRSTYRTNPAASRVTVSRPLPQTRCPDDPPSPTGFRRTTRAVSRTSNLSFGHAGSIAGLH